MNLDDERFSSFIRDKKSTFSSAFSNNLAQRIYMCVCVQYVVERPQ